MKTNIILKSNDRNLYGVVIRQETKTGFLNVTDLTRAYEIERSKKGWSLKRVDNILASADNAERLYYVLQKQGYLIDTEYDSIKQGIHGFMKDVEKDGLTKILKKLKAYKTTGRGENKAVSADPYVWILLAMEFNPEIYATAVCWLGDGLLLNRIEAGNMHNELSRAISRFADVDYKRVAKGINYIVFGRHETGIRNTANQKQLKEVENIEKYIATMIDMHHLRAFDAVINELIIMYNKKWKKSLIA